MAERWVGLSSWHEAQASKPAEFKHISKRRKEKLKRIPLVMANEHGRARP